MKTVTDLVYFVSLQRMPVKRRHAGFTLVELIVVMVLIGIMAVVALPKFSGMAFRDVAYKDKVKATIEYARKAAIARRRYTCVAIAADGSVTLTAELVEPQNHAGNCATPYPALALAASSTNTYTAPTSVTVSSAPTALPLTFMFDAQGISNSTTTQTLTVTDGDGSTSSLVIEARSGYVH